MEYESEAESNAGSVLLTQNQSLPTPPPLTPLSKQVAARAGAGAAGLEVAKPQVFDGTFSKVSGFVTACKLYRKAKMGGIPVEE